MTENEEVNQKLAIAGVLTVVGIGCYLKARSERKKAEKTKDTVLSVLKCFSQSAERIGAVASDPETTYERLAEVMFAERDFMNVVYNETI